MTYFMDLVLRVVFYREGDFERFFAVDLLEETWGVVGLGSLYIKGFGIEHLYVFSQ